LKHIGGFFFLFVLLAAGVYLQAQAAPPTHVTDPAALRPPPGARVAIYEFSDMECPDCARANPVLREAAEKYHIPWLRHDFPLPYHAWSFDAAVDARWFDTKSKKLGDAFRDAVFADQANIQTPEQLRAFAEGFAAKHNVIFPFVVDPLGKLAAEVKADYALGQRIGIEHTPTIWVVTNKTSGVPFVEVVDRTRLYEIIDEALAETAHGPSHTPATARHSATHNP
jgi:protein-disulfide isomerase